jgi:hypothetical protein
MDWIDLTTDSDKQQALMTYSNVTSICDTTGWSTQDVNYLNGHFPEHKLLTLEESLITIYRRGREQISRPLEYMQANAEY